MAPWVASSLPKCLEIAGEQTQKMLALPIIASSLVVAGVSAFDNSRYDNVSALHA